MIKKLGKKKIVIISLCLLLVLAGSAVFFLYQKQGTDNTEEEIVLKQGQSLVYGQIASIYGNEITYYVVEKQEETTTVQIPVGTQVTTRLGTVTTFSRLAAGDNIKMLVQEEGEEQVILEIWIVD